MHATSLLAFETDQYNLPPVPLADIGDEVSEYVEENIREALVKINAEISARQTCVENTIRKTSKCDPPEIEWQKLAYLRSEQAAARAVFKRLGDGIIPFTKSETYMNSHRFRSQPARYKTSYKDSIFVLVPSNYLTISPTVNMYGSQFGTDKIAHFFQQGYAYYKIYERALAKGSTPNDAHEKAVRWGKTSERTYFGILVSGVFSNADLYANYAGMKFYQGLTKPTKIGNVERPATLFLKNGIWTINENESFRELLVKPFISAHLNEALNPSAHIPGLRSSIRGIVKKQSCPQWRALYPDRTKEDFEETTRALMLWNGEDYGFKNSEKFITISNTCFAGSNRPTTN